MNIRNPQVDEYLIEGCGRCPLGNTPECKVNNWPEELKQLRRIILDSGLKEERKWGIPCYTFQNKNIVSMAAFKENCVISFFKGALLKDAKGILEKPGKNTQSVRLIRFTNVQDILVIEPHLKTYIHEAIEAEKNGLKVDFKQKNELTYPEELTNIFEENPAFKTAFEALTPGRQRGYILYFSEPKQSKSRDSRIEKCMQQIFEGKGLYDKYSMKK